MLILIAISAEEIFVANDSMFSVIVSNVAALLPFTNRVKLCLFLTPSKVICALDKPVSLKKSIISSVIKYPLVVIE